ASTAAYWWWWYPSVWRTEDFGQTWELVFQTDFPSTGEMIMSSWSGRDALTDFNFRLFTDPGGEYWYYYSLDGGATFDSLLTALYQSSEGYLFSAWGDSLMVLSWDADSIYISVDRGQTLQFRLHYPEGEQTAVFDGPSSQLISLNYRTGKAFYHGPYSLAGPEALPLPQTAALRQNYPNPFNITTRITFDLPAAGPVTLKVYDLLGREVATLVNGMNAPGHHSVLFDGSNLPSGIYLYRIEMGSVREAKKMLLLK
ncbi:MAG: T9SS type A sorting domain-containing protein, partial [bacterium]